MGNDTGLSILQGRFTISIHVPAWGTTANAINSLIVITFQSTFPRGERLGTATKSTILGNFNPRSRVGNDESTSSCDVNWKKHFNPRSRVGNDYSSNCFAVYKMHFNPRSRVGNDQAWRKWHGDENISIHVPAWGTTYLAQAVVHTPHYFNPRSRVGNDIRPSTYTIGITEISIHVPAWGTTSQ